MVISHPDNTLEVNILITPFHIVPEWYFLSFYTKLKTIPDKNSGINILIITILLFFMNDSFGFINNIFNTGITIYFFFWICFIWIRTEIPKVNFICLCRFYIYWYLLMFFILVTVRARGSRQERQTLSTRPDDYVIDIKKCSGSFHRAVMFH